MNKEMCKVCGKNLVEQGFLKCKYCLRPNKSLKTPEYLESWSPIELDSDKEPYIKLKNILNQAYEQASQGKGKERHANDKDFDKQPICEIGRMVGLGYNLGQAMKKSQESLKLLEIKGKEAARNELLGAINYLASAILLIDEKEDKQ